MEWTDVLFKLMYDDEKQHMLRFDQAQMKKKSLDRWLRKWLKWAVKKNGI